MLRFENEAEDLLHYLKDAGLDPGLEATVQGADGDEVVLDAGDGREVRVLRTVAETVSVVADPVAAAARRAARAARARARPLRAMTPSSARPKRRSWSRRRSRTQSSTWFATRPSPGA